MTAGPDQEPSFRKGWVRTMTKKTTRPTLMWLAAAVVLPARMTLAAGDAESPGLFTGDIGNIIWSLITFAAVIFVLGKFAWAPILKVLKSREDFIRNSIEDAEAANQQAQQQLAEYTEQLAKAKAEATAIVEEGRRNAEAVKRDIQDEARKEADAMIARAKREIGIARETAVSQLYNLSADLATHMAAKVIGKELTLNLADQERLIEESIAELGRTKNSEN
jgi:F-type H+-transporting ATPase subunit b